MKAEPAKLPQGCEAFAKAAAELAEEHSIESFEMTMKPKFARDDFASRQTYSGDIKVRFWQTDGRGRPSRNIRVRYEASVEFAVEYTPES